MNKQLSIAQKFKDAIVFIGLGLSCQLLIAAEPPSSIVVENFDRLPLNQPWSKVAYTKIIDDCGLGTVDNKCLRVEYAPAWNGSTRLTKRLPIPAHDHYTLSYDLYFEPGFEYVRGGKLPGLGSKKPTTGCDAINAEDWSVRSMWSFFGAVRNYFYSQDRTEDCGAGEISSRRVFGTGRWHHVELNVKLNTQQSPYSGYVIQKIDGQVVADDRQLKLREVYTPESLISTFMFSTFFGGDDTSWSPSRQVFARFDNFEVRPFGNMADELAIASRIGLIAPQKPKKPKLVLSQDKVENHIFYEQNFDKIPAEKYTNNLWKSTFPETNWVVGPTEKRVFIDGQRSVNEDGNSIQVLYPKERPSGGDSGTRWHIGMSNNHRTLALSYWVYFDDEFNFQKKGKLPGMGHTGTSISDPWRVYFSWRQDGLLGLDLSSSSGYRHEKLNFEGAVPRLAKGQWQLLQMYLVLNVKGQSDGSAELWLNQRKIGFVNRLSFDPSGETGSLDTLFFYTYLDSNEDTTTKKSQNQEIWFDEIILSEKPLQ